jgi:transcription initiation factor TFIIA large subunit
LDEEEDEEAEQTDHIILCQFEKVTRIKNKWKCILKDGIMNINGKDYLFNKANGDFEW